MGLSPATFFQNKFAINLAPKVVSWQQNECQQFVNAEKYFSFFDFRSELRTKKAFSLKRQPFER